MVIRPTEALGQRFLFRICRLRQSVHNKAGGKGSSEKAAQRSVEIVMGLRFARGAHAFLYRHCSVGGYVDAEPRKHQPDVFPHG